MRDRDLCAGILNLPESRIGIEVDPNRRGKAVKVILGRPNDEPFISRSQAEKHFTILAQQGFLNGLRAIGTPSAALLVSKEVSTGKLILGRLAGSSGELSL